jgi:hypothetical protein
LVQLLGDAVLGREDVALGLKFGDKLRELLVDGVSLSLKKLDIFVPLCYRLL